MFGRRVKLTTASALCAYCGVFVSTAAASDLERQVDGWGTAHASWVTDLAPPYNVFEMVMADRAGGAGDLLMQTDDAGVVAQASWGNYFTATPRPFEMVVADRAGGAGDLLMQWSVPRVRTY